MGRAAGRVLAAAALAALVLVAGAGPAAAADAQVVTARIRATGDVEQADLERYVALAEAAFPAWKAYFGAEPRKADLPLTLDVRRDRDGFLAALSRAHVGPQAVASAGGYYDPGSKCSYLFLQPHDASTRLLVLHELTHQWQAKAQLGNDLTRAPTWHKEGIAEWFGHHRRTAAGVDLGALDVVTIDERPLECADRVRRGVFDPWAVGSGAVAAPDYVDSLALVGTLLRTKDAGLREALRRFEGELDHGGDAGRKFERAFSGKKDRLAAAAREVWGDFRRTWKIVYIAWDEEAGTIVARGRPWAFLRGTADLPRGEPAIEARVALVGPQAASAGLAIGSKGPEDLIGLELRADGKVVLRRKVRNTWFDLGVATRPAGPSRDPVKLRLALVGMTLRVEVDGVPAITVDAGPAGLSATDFDGTAALYAEGGEARFSDVRTGR